MIIKSILISTVVQIMIFALPGKHLLFAQNPVKVTVDLNITSKKSLKVVVNPPDVSIVNEWVYVIPTIIPGTYMQLDYAHFYSSFKAFSSEGERLKVRQKDNKLYIAANGKNFARLEYEIEESIGKRAIWNEVPGCAGTIFTENSFLLNFQLVTGYFDGFENHPFEVSFWKNPTQELYGAGALKYQFRSDSLDAFSAENYAALIDNPLLYAKPDTMSFSIDQNLFKVAVHAESGHVSGVDVANSIERIMENVNKFSGFTRKEPYHFLLYFIDREKPKIGLGTGNALEHNHSSVYFYKDTPDHDPFFRNLNQIVPHEYFHTLAPLSIHSQEIENFSFDNPKMSELGWLYEGSTDYLATLLNSYYPDMSNRFASTMAYAIEFSGKRAEIPITASSKNIIKKNNFQWLGKMMQLMNFYEKGKLLSLGLDLEIYIRSYGKKRLLDVLLAIKKDYPEGFQDEDFQKIFISYTYPELNEYFDRYIHGEEKFPYDQYLNLLGYLVLEKGEKVNAYAKKINIVYNGDLRKFQFTEIGKNTLGIEKGDVLHAIFGEIITQENFNRLSYPFFYPVNEEEAINMVVIRDGEEVRLEGKSTLYGKITKTMLIDNREATQEQKEMRGRFFGYIK